MYIWMAWFYIFYKFVREAMKDTFYGMHATYICVHEVQSVHCKNKCVTVTRMYRVTCVLNAIMCVKSAH